MAPHGVPGGGPGGTGPDSAVMPVPHVPPPGTTLIRRKPFEYHRYPLYPLQRDYGELAVPSPRSREGSWPGESLVGEAAQVPAQLSKASSRRHIISLPVSPRLLISVEIPA